MAYKVLVVDDEPSMRDVFGKVLGKSGYEVVCAETAEDGLAILKDTSFQVMYFDLKLPGMDGIELCKAVRQDFPMAIIYAITGHTSLFELSDCREAGFDDYFAKPLSIELIRQSAKDAFDKLERWKNK